MKSLNVKIPLSIAQHMDDSAQLNPTYITTFITDHLFNAVNLDKPISELSYNYTFKIDSALHKAIKLIALEEDLPMNELVGRLLAKFY